MQSINLLVDTLNHSSKISIFHKKAPFVGKMHPAAQKSIQLVLHYVSISSSEGCDRGLYCIFIIIDTDALMYFHNSTYTGVASSLQ